MSKLFNSVFAIASVIIVCAACACFFCGCGSKNSKDKIKDGEFPNTIAENAKINDKYAGQANELKEIFTDEFKEICKIPRPSGHVEGIREYLFNWGKSHNLNTFIDQSGCVIMDVPATKGFQDKPNIILQAHMDMVAVGVDGSFDPINTPIVPVFDDEKGTISTGGKTSLGADDAEGICTMLAIAKSNVDHGPLRYIFTYDEETTMEGAKTLSPDVLNADYLINVDCGPVGLVTVSSAGSYKAELSKTYSVATTDKQALSLEIKNLTGGHSGTDIHRGTYNSIKLVGSVIDELFKNDIHCQISTANCGSAVNAIANFASLKLAIDSKDIDKAKEVIINCLNNAKDKNPADNSFTVDMSVDGVCAGAISEQDTKEVLNTINLVPYGVIKMSDDGEIPVSSCNIGVLKVDNGGFLMSFMLRSSENQKIEEFETDMNKYSAQNSFSLKVLNKYPGWKKSDDQSFTDFLLNSYKEACNIEGYSTVVHAGLETCWFVDKKPSLKMACIGADVQAEHDVKETLYTKSLPAHFAMLLHTLQNL